jgi:ubiquitin-like 1-activating enzyme E1 B
MAGNIIPAIATTNAMTAGLCVLQAFKILRYADSEQLKRQAQSVFLTRQTAERVLNAEPVRGPNPECPTCSVTHITLNVDTARAKLSDLVEDILKGQLAYGEEFSITKDGDLLYDADEDAHLDKTFSELGLVAGSSVTVIDDADEDKKVNVQFTIVAKDLPSIGKPINLLEDLRIATRPKAAVPVPKPDTNGHDDANTNGTMNGTMGGSLKRSADEASLEDDIVRKKGKVMEGKQIMDTDDIVVIEDKKDDGVIELD